MNVEPVKQPLKTVEGLNQGVAAKALIEEKIKDVALAAIPLPEPVSLSFWDQFSVTQQDSVWMGIKKIWTAVWAFFKSCTVFFKWPILATQERYHFDAKTAPDLVSPATLDVEERADLANIEPEVYGQDFDRRDIIIGNVGAVLPKLEGVSEEVKKQRLAEFDKTLPIKREALLKELRAILQKALPNFSDNAREKLRYEIQDLMQQGSFALTKGFENRTLLYLSIPPGYSFSTAPLIENRADQRRTSCQTALQADGKLHVSYTTYFEVKNVAVDKVVGFDSMKLEIIIDLSKLDKDSLLKTSDTTEIIETYHGFREKLEDIVW